MSAASFDIYAYGPVAGSTSTPLSELIEAPSVTSHNANAGQWSPIEADDELFSGGGFTGQAGFTIQPAPSSKWSLEVTFKFEKLPNDFTDIPGTHAFIGGVDQPTCSAGLFFSRRGIAYTNSVIYTTAGGIQLHLNGAVQVLPQSVGVVEEGTFYTLRLLVDGPSKTTFIYITETALVAQLGHQLRYILPAFENAKALVPAPSGMTVSVRCLDAASDPTETVRFILRGIGLGHGLVVPNLAPVADAGTDQAARTCSIVQLDGRASFDPEGAPLQYAWRFIDGPITSELVISSDDGLVAGLLSPILHTQLDAPNRVAVGDVVLLLGETYNVIAVGAEPGGYTITVDDGIVAGNGPHAFRVLRQHGLANATSAQPTFFPDVAGLYKFDLVVFDGDLESPATTTIINVTESPIPRGLTPDVRFLWNYISDFWKLVEGTDVIETFWSALAQVAATELLTLWQHDYSKSLRDIQRTFQRRWLHYDLYVEDPQIEATSVRTITRAVQSKNLASNAAFAGTRLELFVDGRTLEVELTNAGSPEANVALLGQRLWEQYPGITAELLVANDSTTKRVLLQADVPFTLTAASTATALFDFPVSNDLPRGTAGAAIGLNSYRVDATLQHDEVSAGDYLVIDGSAYRIARITDDAGDPWPSQRLVLADPLPMTAGSSWVIAGATRSKYLDFYNALCVAGDTAIYEIVNKSTGELGYVAADVLASVPDGGSALLTEQKDIAPYLARSQYYDVFFHSVYRRTYMPVDPLVIEVPVLQETIRNSDDTQVLRQNIDFFRTTFRGQDCLRFVTGDPDVWQGDLPPKRLWAETTYIDNRPTIEQNFGIPAEFTLDDLSAVTENVDYLSVVRGLWYSYLFGPTIYNLRVGTQILLGLPFAEEAGTIVELDTEFSPSQGRILVQDTNEQAIVRSYTYPRVLPLEVNPATGVAYAVGDTISQFAPLVEGAEVVDYVKDPRWFEGYLQQGSFFEVEKFFKFLVRVDSAAFNLSTLLFASQFVRRIKPTYTFPSLVVRSSIEDTTVEVDDDVSITGRLMLFAGAKFGGGQASMFDQPRAGGGGFWNHFDRSDPNVAPTAPNPTVPVNWAFDQDQLSPSESPVALLRRVVPPGGELPAADSIYHEGMPVFTSLTAVLNDGSRFWIPQAGAPFGVAKVISSAVTLTRVVAFARVTSSPMNLSTDGTVTFTLLKNGTVVGTYQLTPQPHDGKNPFRVYKAFTVSIPVSIGDTLTARIAASANFNTFLESGAVVAGIGQDWLPDQTLPAGTYTTVLAL